MKDSLLTTTSRMLFLAAAVVGGSCSEADDFDMEYVVKAAISLNLARFTEWPDNTWAKDSHYIDLCVFGNKTVSQAFSQLENKAIGKRYLHVISPDSPILVENCNIVYVGGLNASGTTKLLSVISGQPILSIGEQDDFLEQGGLVNLKKKEGKINIQVNLDAVIRSGIKISSRVLSLTTIFKGKNAGHDRQ